MWLCFSSGAKYISNQLGIWSKLRLFVRSVICSILLFPPPSVSAIGRTGIFWPVAAQGRGEGANLNNGGGRPDLDTEKVKSLEEFRIKSIANPAEF